ncbi:MAG: hypothetical protein CVV39_00920 [Planctomycetes bacterium HGW-Planctomycetes-1]|nr:MAG: hypothetical protein CVV39_00920 [Planctomycetes bacterium HGW-Planctomycetes-1]
MLPGWLINFFRGRLSVEAECIECDVFELTITNKSDNSGFPQTLKGGDFELYWEDAAGNRAEVPDFGIDSGWTSSSTLVYDGTVTATFIKPTAGEPVKYILVYRGNICENPNQPDADDENAIAVTVFTPPSDNCCGVCSYCGADPTPSPIRISSLGITGNDLTCCYSWTVSGYKYTTVFEMLYPLHLPFEIYIPYGYYYGGYCRWEKVFAAQIRCTIYRGNDYPECDGTGAISSSVNYYDLLFQIRRYSSYVAVSIRSLQSFDLDFFWTGYGAIPESGCVYGDYYGYTAKGCGFAGWQWGGGLIHID